MKGKEVFPSANDLFRIIADKVGGGLDKLNEERFRGNLKPTEIAVNLVDEYIQACPENSVARYVYSIRLILGEEDLNTELLQGVEKAVRAREETETKNGNSKVATQLKNLTFQPLIKDSEEINARNKASLRK